MVHAQPALSSYLLTWIIDRDGGVEGGLRRLH